MGYSALIEKMGRVNDVLNAKSILEWDSRTMMPPGGALTRAKQVSTLAVIARDMLVADDTRSELDAAEREIGQGDGRDVERTILAKVREAIEFHRRIPGELTRKRTELGSAGQIVWEKARETSDFQMFLPVLEQTIALNRELAEAIGYEDHPYDALMYRFEPGETVRSLGPLFKQLRSGLLPLVRAIAQRPQPRFDFLERDYPEDAQYGFALKMAERVGFDLNRGRLDTTVHPFEVSFTRNDVRITTRFSRNYMPMSLFGALHEAGHALYEQGVDEAYTRTPLATDLVGLYAVGGVSFGAHESQSRLFENHVGRARAFWELHFEEARKAFPAQLGDVDVDSFWRAINRVRPGFIRVEADELTYDFHIMLRVDIERQLIDGSLKVKDLPEAWNAMIKDYLGLDVPNDRLGVLQDVHWAAGQVGTFCNYTIGNVMAGQLFAEAQKDRQIAAGLKGGDYRPLHRYMTENVHRHGRRYTRNEVLVRATGRPLEAQPYIDYLTDKYVEIYTLDRRALQ